MAQRTLIVNNVPRGLATKSNAGWRHRVVALAYDELCTFEFGIAVELFGLPRSEIDNGYAFKVCGLESGVLRATGGMSVLPRRRLSGLFPADTIIIPGWRNADELPPRRLLRILRTAHQRGARLVSICSGAFVLAATGLLDGRRATTHWRFVDKLARAFPAINLRQFSTWMTVTSLLRPGARQVLGFSLHIVRKVLGLPLQTRWLAD